MLTRWDDVDQVFQAMDIFKNLTTRLFADIDRGRSSLPGRAGIINRPRVNLYDADETLEARVELPGVTAHDLDVRIQGNFLEISGTRKSDAPSGYSAHRLERGTAEFSRRFTMPVEVEAGKVEAVLENGILSLRLPKAEAAKPRRIEIKAK